MKPSTLAITAGSTPARAALPVAGPIHVSAVSYYDDAAELDAALDGGGYAYGRIRAPNAESLEQAIAALEGAEACVSYASGMSALRALWDSLALREGDVAMVPADGYGASLSLLKRLASERRVTLQLQRFTAPEALAAIAAAKPKLVFLESVTNPLLSVPDVTALASAAHHLGAAVAVDATFSSPLGQRPLSLGADLVLHSTTKWINGHSDALGGVVSGAKTRIEPMRAARILTGDILGPFEAYLTLRGVRTLPLRMKAHSEHALALAKALESSGKVANLRYPGLPSHPDHAVARRVLEVEQSGFGGLMAFELPKGGRAEAFRFLEAVKLARPAPSLGDVATLVMHAASASARRMTPEERERAGISERLIRVSVGLEDPMEIAADLLQAIDSSLR